MADKKGRVQEIIQRNLSEIILYDLKSELTAFASVNEVKMTPDYSYCTVYVSHLIPEKSDDLVKYLNVRAGRIRTMLASRLSIYKTPALTFVKDELFEKGQAMDELIAHANYDKPLTLKDLEKKEKKTKKTTGKNNVRKVSKARKTK
jgi:ribosome-binding factor A